MRKFTILDVKGMRGYDALTQEQERIIKQLLDTCDQLESKFQAIHHTRRDVLCAEFDRQACTECLELSAVYDKSEFFRKMMKVMLEKVARDFVDEAHVDDLIENMQFKVKYFNGDIEKVVDLYEAYYTCGSIVPVAQTWRERTEELEKGMVIYYEPTYNTAI